MNGRNHLEKRLLELGATKQQINSKIIDLVLHALAESNDVTRELAMIYEEKIEKAEAQKREQASCISATRCAEGKYRRMAEECEEAAKKYAEAERELMNFNSEWAKDCYRLMRTFKESVEVNTCYDNTAYIRALGEITAASIRKSEEQGE